MKSPNEILKGQKDIDVAHALVEVLGDCPWEAVALAHAYIHLLDGADVESSARIAFKMRARKASVGC